jgi:DNA-binding beta-propeller fold protein YncE
VVVLALLGVTKPLFAEPGFGDVQHYVFVPSAESSTVMVIDIATDKIAGRLDLGLTPRQIELSAPLAKLIAVDGTSPRLVLADLATTHLHSLTLDFTPDRLLISPDGAKLAVVDALAGNIAVIDLASAKQTARIANLPPLVDAMFSSDGASLFLAAEKIAGIGVVDVALGKQTATLPVNGTASVSSFTRSPSGRSAFARSADGAAVRMVDLKTGKPPRDIGSTPGTAPAYPSGTGAYLLIPDERSKSFTIIHGDTLTAGAVLDAGAELGTPSSAWFDSVAFLPSRADRKVLVYDLWRLSKQPDITLPGRPGRGAVTPDGGKFYLPLEDRAELVVIDAQKRKLSTVITLPARPLAAVMAGSYGICH